MAKFIKINHKQLICDLDYNEVTAWNIKQLVPKEWPNLKEINLSNQLLILVIIILGVKEPKS